MRLPSFEAPGIARSNQRFTIARSERLVSAVKAALSLRAYTARLQTDQAPIDVPFGSRRFNAASISSGSILSHRKGELFFCAEPFARRSIPSSRGR
jgi:hypothetical protein